MLKAILFDLDDVLISSMNAHGLAYVKALSEVGVNITLEEYLRYSGATGREVLKFICRDANHPDINIENVYQRKHELFPEFADYIKRIEGTIELLKSLYGKFKIGLVTSSSPQSLRITLLRLSDISDLFDAIVTAEDVTLGKPHPEAFLKAAELLGVKPDECLVMEDSDLGIEAALKSGMKAIKVCPI